MTLRKQLIIVSLCLLALPWSGCQYVKEMESVLRKNQLQLLQSAALPIAQTLRSTLRENTRSQLPAEQTIYAPFRNNPVALDGYEDEWKNHPIQHFQKISKPEPEQESKQESNYFKMAVSKNNLLVFVHITDNDITYHHPSSPSPTHNDHLRIITKDATSQQQFILYTSGQGAIQALNAKNSSRNNTEDSSEKSGWKPLSPSQKIQGYWHEMASGYSVEFSIPLSLLKSNIELSVFNTERFNAISSNTTHHQVAQRHLTTTSKILLHPIFPLTEQLSPFQQADWDISIINRNGWILSPQIDNQNSTPRSNIPPKKSQSITLWNSAVSRFYRYIMDGIMEDITPSNTMPKWPFSSRQLSQSTTNITPHFLTEHHSQWYKVPNSQRSILSVISPITEPSTSETLGYVVLTQSSDALLSLTNNALRRIINLSLTTAALSALVLLSFASILSYRIRLLRNKTEAAVNLDGKIQLFPASNANDEIGDLSRSYAALLRRVHDYNDYLETLSGKLAHELRTPLTISKSSIEMLRMTAPDDTEKQQRYLNRAEDGLERLRLILNAMSEASRVEQVIQHSEIVSFNVSNLINDMYQAYQDSYSDFTFSFYQHQDLTDSQLTLSGSPELVAQMLDKLVDNATGFAPPHSQIQLSLTPFKSSIRLTVSNIGPLLPENMQQQLFDSMVSIREERSDTPHLGLGLYIAKLIAQHHNGNLSASNNVQNDGVEFYVDLPTR